MRACERVYLFSGKTDLTIQSSINENFMMMDPTIKPSRRSIWCDISINMCYSKINSGYADCSYNRFLRCERFRGRCRLSWAYLTSDIFMFCFGCVQNYLHQEISVALPSIKLATKVVNCKQRNKGSFKYCALKYGKLFERHFHVIIIEISSANWFPYKVFKSSQKVKLHIFRISNSCSWKLI